MSFNYEKVAYVILDGMTFFCIDSIELEACILVGYVLGLQHTLWCAMIYMFFLMSSIGIGLASDIGFC